MFASDYPHPEGGRDPIGRFDASLDAAAVAAAARERFYPRELRRNVPPGLVRRTQ
jgi:uncharacterized protein